ncbi:hypothetical protein ACHAWX_005600 [Stephanocyclus meneghinianus]
MTSSPEHPPQPSVLHDPNRIDHTRTQTSQQPPPQRIMIHPRIPRDTRPNPAVLDEHLTTTWSRDDDGRPISHIHSWHPSHPPPHALKPNAPRMPHAGTHLPPPHSYAYLRQDSRSLRTSPDYYRHYPRRPSHSWHYDSAEPHRPVHEGARHPPPAPHFRPASDSDAKTGLLLPPHDGNAAPTTVAVARSGNVVGPATGNGCSCKKSKCLKLYCACFSSSVLCSDCKCEGCLNTPVEMRKKDNAIEVARRGVLERNPKAFDDKIDAGSGGIGAVGERGLVRPVFGRVVVPPVRRVPEYDFRSLERVTTASPKEESALVGSNRIQRSASREESVSSKETRDGAGADGVTKKESMPNDGKGGDNVAEKSEGVSTAGRKMSPTEQMSMLSTSSFEGNRPIDRYYRPSPTYRPPYPWDGRHYPREMESRRPFPFHSYYDHHHHTMPSRGPVLHHIPDARIPREMPLAAPYPYRPYEPPPLAPPVDNRDQKQHRVGCKCKKSMCLKKYCECFQNRIQCGISCKCINCGNKPGGIKTQDDEATQEVVMDTEEAVATMVSLGQSSSMEGESTPNLHVVSEDKEPSGIFRPPSLPSLASTCHNDDESLKENTREKDKASEQKLDFLAALASSALDDLRGEKRKAEEMESFTADPEAEKKRKCIEEAYKSYYENNVPSSTHYHQNYHWNVPSNENAESTSIKRPTHPLQMLKSITKQFHNVPTKSTTSTENIKITKLPKGLTFRKVCSSCGRQRAEHGEFGFGNKCPLTTCGKCGADAQCHQSRRVSMGVTCTLSESDGAVAGYSKKYEAMLADLAARAEIRAEMGKGDGR